MNKSISEKLIPIEDRYVITCMRIEQLKSVGVKPFPSLLALKKLDEEAISKISGIDTEVKNLKP